MDGEQVSPLLSSFLAEADKSGWRFSQVWRSRNFRETDDLLVHVTGNWKANETNV